ncbi:MAG: hypothetical protein GF329_15645 [Candidatus Lokiarchaeota archaeon]|nr:hypothetical protein [Candidatus Lokiarchaeota archaeon]
MKIPEYIDLYKSKINETIRKFFQSLRNKAKNPFLKDFYDEINRYLLSGGKRLRPLICIAAYNAFKSEQNDKIIFPSIAVELLHNASLIHDDIIDRDDFRRNNPSFHYRFNLYYEKNELEIMDKEHFGNSMGILGGDKVYFCGLSVLLDNNFRKEKNFDAIKYYKLAFQELCDGVIIETEMINRDDISMEEYIQMISLKTGALIEKSALIGASYAEANEKYLPLLSAYSKNLGIIFQITDDILGSFGDEKITGKPTDGDIREGKKTCLLIDSLKRLDKKDAQRLKKLVGNPYITQKAVEEVKNLFLKSDSVQSCKNLANKYYSMAEEHLNDLKPHINRSEFEFFQSLLNFVLRRKY